MVTNPLINCCYKWNKNSYSLKDFYLMLFTRDCGQLMNGLFVIKEAAELFLFIILFYLYITPVSLG